MIDLVGDEADAEIAGRLDQRLQGVRRHHRSGRIGGAGDQDAVEPLPRVFGREHLRRDGVAGRGGGLDEHHLAAERLEDVLVGGVSGACDGDAGPRLEQREEGQDEGRGRAHRHGDATDRHLDAVGLGIVARDALAQFRRAERQRIADLPAHQSVGRRLADAHRGRRCRLADLHVDDALALGFRLRRRGHHVHDQEGRDGSAPRGGEEAQGDTLSRHVNLVPDCCAVIVSPAWASKRV